MANLFDQFKNISAPTRMQQNNNGMNILSMYKQVQNNPGMIVDILLQNGKINQAQYNDLQAYKNNPQMIVNYLLKNGNSELNNIISNVNNLQKGGM